MQIRLDSEEKERVRETILAKPYSIGPYNVTKDGQQWVRIGEGCPHSCPWCAEPKQSKWYGMPKPESNQISLLDMNLLSHPEALPEIQRMANLKFDGKVIHFEAICGLDYRFMNLEICQALKAARFQNLRIAWDSPLRCQYKLKDAIKLLVKAGFKRDEITLFMICNFKYVSFEEQCYKLDLCKVWNVKVADCHFDNQTGPNFTGIYWKTEEQLEFRAKVRSHNQMIVQRIYNEQYSRPKIKKFLTMGPSTMDGDILSQEPVCKGE